MKLQIEQQIEELRKEQERRKSSDKEVAEKKEEIERLNKYIDQQSKQFKSNQTTKGTVQNVPVAKELAEKERIILQMRLQIEQQIDELSTSKWTIQMMTDNTTKFKEMLNSGRHGSPVVFNVPSTLQNYPETHQHVQRFHSILFETLESTKDVEKLSVKKNLESQLQELKSTNISLEESLAILTKQQEGIKRQLQRSENEKEDLKTRLSQVAGAKLVAGNTSITDLGDKFRPTRIAEMYSELYDNEWTETIDVLSTFRKDLAEDLIVRHLYFILKGCFKTCQYIAREQLDQICQLCFMNIPLVNMEEYFKSHVTEIKQLKDARKGMAYDVATKMMKMVFEHEKFKEECLKFDLIDEHVIGKVFETDYANKCTMVCWFMVVQDPEMYLDDDLIPGKLCNKDMYKEYTASGKYVQYSVWPALFLQKNGPLLTKGVAHCYK